MRTIHIALWAISICIIGPQSALSQETLIRLEIMATQQAIAIEQTTSPQVHREGVAQSHLPQRTWEKLVLRPYVFAPNTTGKPFFDTTIPPGARRIDPNSPPTPFPKSKKKKRVTQKSTKVIQKYTTTLPPSIGKAIVPIIPSPIIPDKEIRAISNNIPKVITPTTPPMPVPGPRNPLDDDSDIPKKNEAKVVEPTWQWPES